MTLLRASSDAIGLDVDLAATIGKGGDAGEDPDGGGVPAGGLLVAFTEAIVRAEFDDLERLRTELIAEVGPDGAAHAAATVSAFSGLVRVADGTGIPIDDGLAAVSIDARAELGLADYAGAANSPNAEARTDAFSTIDALFDNGVAR